MNALRINFPVENEHVEPAGRTEMSKIGFHVALAVKNLTGAILSLVFHDGTLCELLVVLKLFKNYIH